MLSIFKMDLHRLKHSKVFYVSIIFITIMAVALVMSGMSTSMDGLLGVASSAADDGDAFMTGMMGTGVIFILLGIILTLFVCGDYSGRFANNIFTTHSNPKDYIGGKMLSMAVTSGFLLILYTIECMVALSIFGHSIVLSGGFLGLIFYLLQKWLLSCALCAVVLLVTVFTRNIAWGVVAAFLIATGGLSMGIAMLARLLHLDWLTSVFSFTISGSSGLCTLSFNALIFFRVLLASVAWVAVGCLASRKVLKTKDI